MNRPKGPLLLVAFTMSAWLVGCSAAKPTVWYCLAYNTPNNPQYKVAATVDRGWSRVHSSLASHVRWRINTETPTEDRLRDVDLLIVLNPEAQSWEGGPAPGLMRDEEIAAIVNYVREGGSLLFGSNQDYGHNIEKARSNRLLERFGMRMMYDAVGLKLLDIPESTPVVGGLRWRFFFGSGVELTTSGMSRPQVWVWNDPEAPTLEREPGERVPLMVAGQVGQSGRVIVQGDSGWTANGTIGYDDNWLILWNQIRWLTHDRLPERPPPLKPWSPDEAR